MDTIENILLGLMTGLVSGLLVTWFYREKDKNDTYEMMFESDKQNMSRYIDQVCHELNELCIHSSRDTKYIKRLLINPPRFMSFDKTRIDDSFHKVTEDVYRAIQELFFYINHEEPSDEYEVYKLKYIAAESKLSKLQLRVLEMELKRKDVRKNESPHS